MNTQRESIWYLDERDLVLAGADDPQTYLNVVTDCFRLHAAGAFVQPPKLYLRWNNGRNRMNLMPACLTGLQTALGVKCVTSVPDNPVQRGLPRGDATVMLYSSETGLPTAIVSGNHISRMRTAAVTAVGARYLANSDASSLGLLGAGPISATHVRFLQLVCPGLKRVTVFDIVSARAERFCQRVSARCGIEIRVAKTPRDVVSGHDIILTATSGVEPFVEAEWIEPGCFFSNVGIMEAKPELIGRAERVVVDDKEQCLHRICPLSTAVDNGLVRRDAITELGQIVAGNAPSRQHSSDFVFLNPIGMGMLDVACANLFCRQALDQKLGKRLDNQVEIYDEFGIEFCEATQSENQT